MFENTLPHPDQIRDAFLHETQRLREIYSVHALKETIANADFLIGMHGMWQDALQTAAAYFNLPSDDLDRLPYLLEERTAIPSNAASVEKKTVIGLAGPGATGKETLTKKLGYPKVVNTTTRAQRTYEQHGVHYQFTSEEGFHGKVREGKFIHAAEKPGRGWYGIDEEDLIKPFRNSDTVIIEESPDPLLRIGKELTRRMPESDYRIVYILPQPPILIHLAARLATRCLVAGENFRDVIESTLGKRQVDEFLSLIPGQRSGIPITYVINDDVDRAVQVINQAIGK